MTVDHTTSPDTSAGHQTVCTYCTNK